MSFSERDLQSKLDEMEAEINQKTASDSQKSNTKSVFSQIEMNPSPQVKSRIESSKAWFNSLPKVGKAAVAVGAVWLGFSILGAVLHIVSSILSIAIFGFVLYVGYSLFNSNSDSN